MNTCALSGQAAGTLAAECLRTGKTLAELDAREIETVRRTLMRDDMLIPGARICAFAVRMEDLPRDGLLPAAVRAGDRMAVRPDRGLVGELHEIAAFLWFCALGNGRILFLCSV